MSKTIRIQAVLVLALTVLALGPVWAASGAELAKESQAALKSLYAKTPAAKTLGDTAKGILVFPSVTKAGLMVGAQAGEGVLLEKGKVTDYYSTAAASVGLQAGVQTYGYAFFFMNDEDLKYLKTSDGWSLGSGPNIVIADEGTAKDPSTLTSQKGVYGFIFSQKGLMAGARSRRSEDHENQEVSLNPAGRRAAARRASRLSRHV